ncbi:MAG: flagellar hook-basal body complex protein [Firmicutes bacterium]|nr:flagellar hook-basal body complex protein [Bacillota bacterium]
MLRSLYSGVSGMRGNQTKMDVIGNNIANVNTTAFKSGRVRFKDMLSQTISNAQGPNDGDGTEPGGRGGVNPKQVGLGSTVAAIDTMMEGGALQPTGRDLDFAIENEGFFVVSEDTDGNIKRYTRDGAFFTDFNGNLVNSDGLRIMGYGVDDPEEPSVDVGDIEDDGEDVFADDSIDLKALVIPNMITGEGGDDEELQSFSIDGTGLVKAVYSDGKPYILGRVALAKFENPEGLEKMGGNLYTDSSNSGTPQSGKAAQNGFGTIRQGALEMSNVDLANEFTDMITTSRAFQANSRTITTSDEMLQELINLKR